MWDTGYKDPRSTTKLRFLIAFYIKVKAQTWRQQQAGFREGTGIDFQVVAVFILKSQTRNYRVEEISCRSVVVLEHISTYPVNQLETLGYLQFILCISTVSRYFQYLQWFDSTGQQRVTQVVTVERYRGSSSIGVIFERKCSSFEICNRVVHVYPVGRWVKYVVRLEVLVSKPQCEIMFLR